MDLPLAVYSPIVGMPSETFIRRHVRDLAPGRTLLLTRSTQGPFASEWIAQTTTIELDHNERGPLRHFVERALSRAGTNHDLESLRLARCFRKHRTRVFLGEYLDGSHRFLALCRRIGIAFFAHAHGYDVSLCLREERWRTAYRDYREAEGLIVPASFMRDRLVDLGLRQDKIHVIPYGVDLPAAVRSHRGSGRVRCLAVGRMVAKKAPHLLLESFARARHAARSTLELDWIGDGPLLAAVTRQVADLGLRDCVRLHGAQTNARVFEAMAAADLFVQHSRVDPETGDEEGLPVAILEAMAHGLPIVSTRHAGIPESVIDGVTGYLVAENDVEAMAARLVELADDAPRRGQMGAKGRQRAIERFSFAAERQALLTLMGLAEDMG